MATLIEVLEGMPNSSIYGAAADEAFTLLSGANNINELMDAPIQSPEVILRSVIETLANISNRRGIGLSKLIASIPSVAVQDDFI